MQKKPLRDVYFSDTKRIFRAKTRIIVTIVIKIARVPPRHRTARKCLFRRFTATPTRFGFADLFAAKFYFAGAQSLNLRWLCRNDFEALIGKAKLFLK